VIGVIARGDQLSAVEEFFELFKTPWEVFQEGHAYDVVIATVEEVPQVDAPVLVVYGADARSIDRSLAIVRGDVQRGGWLQDGERRIPLYGRCATLAHRTDAVESASHSLRLTRDGQCVIRAGYDLFDEVRYLVQSGQPVEHARVPALDLHIDTLRRDILREGRTLLEIPPVPAGHSHAVCLTHDIDFVGIRRHCFDHTMWGFLLRSTVGAARNWVRGRLSLRQMLESWRAAASLPFVYLGWAEDFWRPFEWYLDVEKGLGATYFLIPFKGRTGEHVTGPRARRRGTAYDVTDIPDSIATLRGAGCELGVHGIDAWHDPASGREECARVSTASGEATRGIRMHWLLNDERTPATLEAAGYKYDSTVGYNDTIGYRAGTTQVFRPLGTRTLLELPMHIQDGALFYRQQLDLSNDDAWSACEELIGHARRSGGVLTVLWHDRSHAPERFWGDFYARLVAHLKMSDAWFGTGSHVVNWFEKRRAVRFDRGEVQYTGERIEPPLTVRLHTSATSYADTSWNGEQRLTMMGLGNRPAAAPRNSRSASEAYSLS